MKVGLCTIAFRERSLEDVISIASDYGFDGVEIWGKPPHMPEEYDVKYIEKVRNLVSSKGLEVTAFGSYVHPLLSLHQKHLAKYASKEWSMYQDPMLEMLQQIVAHATPTLDLEQS